MDIKSKLYIFSLLLLLLLVIPVSRVGAAPPQSADANADAAQQITPVKDLSADPLYDDLYDDDLYADDTDVSEVNDPLETLNRGFFWFNDKCYFYVLKPIARGFRIVPQPVRKGLRNMFYNLMSPLNAINALLQLKFKQAGSETARLVLNSTVGLAGFFDPAHSYWGLERKNEDFGQTLGHYGVGEGFYLMLPILGASTLRDGLSLVPDGYADPIYWFATYNTLLVSRGVKTVNVISLDKDSYESIVDEQLDPYLFIRNAYMQKRRFNISD